MYEGGHLLYHATREECVESILDRGLLPGGLREGSRNENFFSPVQPQSARDVWKTRAFSTCVVVIWLAHNAIASKATAYTSSMLSEAWTLTSCSWRHLWTFTFN
jgi:hypothetical protein